MVRKYLKRAARYALERLNERSTRLGLVAFAGALGWHISPENLEQIAIIGTAVLGVVEAIWPDKAAKVVPVIEIK